MANIEKEVTNLELSKYLKKVGFSQDDGIFYWLEGKLWIRIGNTLWNVKGDEGRSWTFYKNSAIRAFTIREITEYFPYYIPKLNLYMLINLDNEIEYYYEGDESENISILDENEANIRAKIAIKYFKKDRRNYGKYNSKLRKV